jgi:hypothetical protein
MSNIKKSWKGKPAINTCSFGTYDYGYNSTKISNATPPAPPPVTGYPIYKITSSDGNDAQQILYTATVDQVNGGTYTHSAYVYLEYGTWVSAGQHWNPWDYGTQQYIPNGVWTRIEDPVTNSGNNYGNVALSYNTNGAVYVTGSQYEIGSFASPLVNGTRSTTQAILDLTNNNTVTANSLTYSSDGTFSFNGSSDYITAGTLPGSFSSFTVSVWFNSTSVSNYRNPIDCNFYYNGTVGNIGPRLEQNSSGALGWVVSGNTSNNSTFDSFVVKSSGLQANTWYNAVITWTNGSANTYLNGVPVTINASTPNGFVNVFNNVIIGKGYHLDSASTRSFTGQISTVQIYNTSLTATQILQNFNALRGRYSI